MKSLIFLFFLLIPPIISLSQSTIEFDGLDDQVTVKHHSDFDLGVGDFTIELKVKSIPNLKTNLTLLSKRDNTNQGINLSITTTGNKGKFKVRLGNQTHTLKDTALKDGQCHFLAIRRRNNKIRLYLDNSAKNTGNNTNSISSLADLLVGIDGVPVNSGGNNPLEGQIEEIRIWNIAKTNAAVFAANNNCLQGNETGLVAYWNMEEGSGQIIHDKVNQHHATLGQILLSESFDPLWQQGTCLASCGTIVTGFQADKNPIYDGQQVSFTNTSTGATDYEWRINGSEVLSTDTNITAYMTKGTHIVELRAINSNTGEDSYHSEVYFVDEYSGVPNTPQANAAHYCSIGQSKGILIEGCEELPLEPLNNIQPAIAAISNCSGYIPPNVTMGTAAHNFKTTSVYAAGGFRLIFQDLESCTGSGYDDPTPINANSPCATSATYPASTLGEARINTTIAVFEYISDLLNINAASPFSIHANQAATITGNPTFEIYFEASTINQPYLGAAAPYFHPNSQGGFQGGFIQEMFTSFGNPGGVNGITDSDINRADGRVVMNFGNIILNGITYQYNSCHLATTCDLISGAANVNEFDLYSTLLHEIMHAMGFASSIDFNTNSKYQSGDYTLFDKMLLNSRAQTPIGSHVMDFSGNYVGAIGDITSDNMGYYNQNNVPTAISSYNSNPNTLVYPIYSPPIWSGLSSLSHFENNVIGSCNIDNYVMNPGLYPCVERRQLSQPEKEVLADLGYMPFQGNFPIGNTDYATTTLGTQVCIPVLNNDNNSSSLTICGSGTTGITPISGGTMFSIITGTNGLQEICFTPDPNFIGTALFEYCITDGNLESACPIMVYVEVTSDYCPDDPCNYICNGGFELGPDFCPSLFTGIPNILRHPNDPAATPAPQVANGWYSSNNGTPDVIIRGSSLVNCSPPTGFDFPSFPFPIDTYIPGDPNNNRLVHTVFTRDIHEGIFTKLVKELIPGKQYRLSFWLHTSVPTSSIDLNLLAHIHDDPNGTVNIGWSPPHSFVPYNPVDYAYFSPNLSVLPFDIIENATNISSNMTPGLGHIHQYTGAQNRWEQITVEFTAPILNPNDQYLVIEPQSNPSYPPNVFYKNHYDDFRLEEINTVAIGLNTTVNYNSSNSTATYTIEVCNNSVNLPLTDIQLEQFLPTGFTINPISALTWTTNSSTGVVELVNPIPNLQSSPPVTLPNNCTTLTLVVDIPPNVAANTDLTACTFASSSNGGNDCLAIANGGNCATFQVPGTDIAIAKSVNTTNVNAGDPITFTVSVSNLGPNTATNVVVNDPLDPNLTSPIVAISPNGLGATYVGGVLTIPSLAVNQQVILTITATVNSAFPSGGNGQIVNCATLDPSLMFEQDLFITNNTSCVSVDVGCGDLQAQGYIVIPENITTISGAIAAGLLPMPQARFQSQKVVVQSILRVDGNSNSGPFYEFAPGSEILMIPNTNRANAPIGFDIPSESILRIKGTHIHGCNNMWRGINVFTEGQLYISENSLIEDAEYAVRAENKSTWYLDESIFRNNYVGLYAPDNGILKTFAYGISGMTFEGQGNFLNTYPGQLTVPDRWPYAAIELHDVLAFSLSEKIHSTFHNLANGILLFNTGAVLRSSVEMFDLHLVNSYTRPNHILPSFSGIGIYSENTTGAILDLTLSGFGNSASSTATIKNSPFGVFTEGRIRFDLQKNNFENFVFNAILCRGANNVDGVILSNRIDMETGGLNAIWMWQNDPMTSLRISNNIIILDKARSFFTPDGILIDENNMPYLLEISNNTIDMREARRGINLRNHNGLASPLNSNIGINDINFFNTRPGGYLAYPNRTGIVTNNGREQYIFCNTVDGDHPLSAINLSPVFFSSPRSNNNNNVFGIRSNQSSSLVMSCNQFDFIPNGIQISANSNVSTRLLGNRFGDVGRGLWLANGAQISNQVDHGNRWIYPTLPPALQNPNSFLAQAWEIAGAQNDNYFPGASDFRYDPNNPDYNPFSNLTTPSSNLWFLQQVILPTTTFDCNSPGNPTCPVPVPLVASPITLSGSDQAVVAGTFASPVFTQTSVFESNGRTYSKLKQNPSLAPVGSAEAAFVNTMNQQCEGEFYTVEQRCHLIKRIPTGIQNQAQSLQQSMDLLLEDLYYLDSLWVEDSLDRDSLKILIDQKGQQIQPLMDQLQQLDVQTKQNQLTVVSSIESINNGISTIGLADHNLKVVNEIYLRTIGKRIYHFTTQEQQDLHQVALQCPLEGGIAVYKARAMVSIYTKVDYELLQNCQPVSVPQPRLSQENKEMIDSIVKGNVQIYPNPTTQSITMNWQLEEGEKGQLLIFNTLGQLVRQELIQGKEGQKQIDLTGFYPGTYFCKLYFDDQEVHQEKLIIIE